MVAQKKNVSCFAFLKYVIYFEILSILWSSNIFQIFRKKIILDLDYGEHML